MKDQEKGNIRLNINGNIMKDFMLLVTDIAKFLDLSKLEFYSCLLYTADHVKKTIEEETKIKITKILTHDEIDFEASL